MQFWLMEELFFVCRHGKGHQYSQDHLSLMLLLEQNFRHNTIVLRVTPKSIMLKFSSILYLILIRAMDWSQTYLIQGINGTGRRSRGPSWRGWIWIKLERKRKHEKSNTGDFKKWHLNYQFTCWASFSLKPTRLTEGTWNFYVVVFCWRGVRNFYGGLTRSTQRSRNWQGKSLPSSRVVFLTLSIAAL